jgi:3'-phosphoadenosine 5'-phosphosulfate sulfotransferase (PAPS reductase)/FAD synthetase
MKRRIAVFNRITPSLSNYDWIVINTSAGKDSQVMMHVVVQLAKLQGFPLNKIVAVHSDLGRVEWKGTRELAEEQAKFYGIYCYVVRRKQDLLDHILDRGMFPSPKVRWCTSDHKRSQVYKLFTRLTKALHKKKVRILNCLGLRAEESTARAKKLPFKFDAMASNGKRHIDQWLPIHHWTVSEVWRTIKVSGCPHHQAYDLGMPRLSCCFCIFAPREALLLAGQHNPELLNEYVRVEKKIGHKFRLNLSLLEIKEALNGGERASTVPCWSM